MIVHFIFDLFWKQTFEITLAPIRRLIIEQESQAIAQIVYSYSESLLITQQLHTYLRRQQNFQFTACKINIYSLGLDY